MLEGKPQILESLGFIITPNGEYFEFGESLPLSRREHSNPNHFHDKAFKKDVLDTEAWKKLNIQGIEPEDARYHLENLVERGIIVGANATNGSWALQEPIIVFASPVVITKEQAVTLENANIKNLLLRYDNQITLRDINIIDKKGEKMQLHTFSEYYANFVEELVQEETPKRG